MITRIACILAALGCAAQVEPVTEEEKGFLCWADPDDDCNVTDVAEPIDVETHGHGPYRVGDSLQGVFCNDLSFRIGDGETKSLRVSELGYARGTAVGLDVSSAVDGGITVTYQCDGAAEETFVCPVNASHVYYSVSTDEGWRMRPNDAYATMPVEADTISPVSPNRLQIWQDPRGSGDLVLMGMTCQYVPGSL